MARDATPPEGLLASIDAPAALRALPAERLPALADELRTFVLRSVAATGGHLASNLGSVELAIALHRVMNTPHDRIVWDVGHQAYPHKILTGRRDAMAGLRRRGGISGFPRRSESDYDAFGTAHASTSISAALGMAVAARQRGERRKVVAVIGDGALSGGMACEALNHAGAGDTDLLVVVNDNGMSISPAVGALAARDDPQRLARWFAAMGFACRGPVDGHDLRALLPVLAAARDASGPRMLHVITRKGHGYAPAERDPVAYHGVVPFDPRLGLPAAKPAAIPSFTQVFGDWLCEAAARDPRVVAVTPAMREGSGLVRFAREHPDRFHDTGIAEQHAVTFAAGLACEGLRPVLAIYSTFLQRGYDQLVHDVCLQKLPVLFAIDRAGPVGADGATHHGAFDLAFLRCVPGLAIMAPSGADECRRMLSLGVTLDGPSAVRYPRGAARDIAPDDRAPITLGRGVVRRRGRGAAILAFGTVLHVAMEVAETLDLTVADMRFVAPLDVALLHELAGTHRVLATLEEGALAGGAASAVAQELARERARCVLVPCGLPDRFLDHGEPAELAADAGLDAASVSRRIADALRATCRRTRATRRPLPERSARLVRVTGGLR